MCKPAFKSVYSQYIEQFIDLKRKLGYKYKNEEIILYRFDKFIANAKINTLGLTKDIMDIWCVRQSNESYRSKEMRLGVIKLFAEYLNQIGIRSYVPYSVNKRANHTFVPHIYTGNEIALLFDAIDNLTNSYQRKDSVIFSLPCLFRVLYATGLRISEAMALRNKDVNLIDKFILVRDSKNGTERIIPISESLCSVCKEYIYYKNMLPIERSEPNDLFFVSLNGNSLIYMSLGVYFRKALAAAGINYIGKQHGPRIHDLRHTFACHVLRNMADSGVDLYYSLPVLSTYLGHINLESTERYVRLTVEMYPHLTKHMETVHINIFPKLSSYE